MTNTINYIAHSLGLYSNITDMLIRNAARADIDGEVRHTNQLISMGEDSIVLSGEQVDLNWFAEISRNQAGQVSWYNQKINETLSEIVKEFGTKDGNGTIAHKLNSFIEHFNKLRNSTNPSDTIMAVQDFQRLLSGFQNLQNKISLQRQNIVGQEQQLLNQATILIQNIAAVNVSQRTTDQETALCRSINELSQIMDIQVQFEHNASLSGAAKIFIAGQSGFKVIDGMNILGRLAYTPTTTTIPGTNLGAIQFTSGSINADIRPFLSGGMLGGFTAADQKLQDMNSVIDGFALQFMNTLNATHNQGTSGQFAPSTLTGTIGFLGAEGTPLTNGTVISGQGTWRIAMHDAQGKIVDYKNIALTPNMTVGGLINSINTGAFVLNNGATFTASLTASGQFQITSNNPLNKISLGSVTGQPVGSLCAGAAFLQGNATNASAFFHLNDLITRISTNPNDLTDGMFSNLSIRSDIMATPGTLAGSHLNNNVMMAVGDFAVSGFNTDTFDALYLSLTQTLVNFAASGKMSAINTNLLDYATDITSFIIESKKFSEDATKDAKSAYETTKLDAGMKSGKTTAEAEYKRLLELNRVKDALEACFAKTMDMDKKSLRVLLGVD